MAVTSTADGGSGASWTVWITRAVARNNTTTIRIGMMVQASSICVLPYTCAGSLSALAGVAWNLANEYTSKVKTTTNMIPVMESTNMDRSKMDLAGVDSGAKMFSRPVEGAAVSAANAADTERNSSTMI